MYGEVYVQHPQQQHQTLLIHHLFSVLGFMPQELENDLRINRGEVQLVRKPSVPVAGVNVSFVVAVWPFSTFLHY